MSDRVKIARLPHRNLSIYDIAAKTAGWGRNSSDSYPGQLQKLDVTILRPELFQILYRDDLPNRTDHFYFHEKHGSGHGIEKVMGLA